MCVIDGEDSDVVAVAMSPISRAKLFKARCWGENDSVQERKKRCRASNLRAPLFPVSSGFESILFFLVLAVVLLFRLALLFLEQDIYFSFVSNFPI